MSSAPIEEAICAHICEREPSDPARYDDLKAFIAPLLSASENADFVLSYALPSLLNTGNIEWFEDDERGTVYVRDC